MDGLDVARGLFVVHGALWIAIGALSPLLLDRNVGSPMVILSGRTDTHLFGADPPSVLADSRVRTLRAILVAMLGGCMLAAGVLVSAIAWFGLGARSIWAMATLTIVAVALIPFWWHVLRPYRVAKTPVGLGDVPPFMWVPLALDAPAVALGWLALA